MSDKRQEILEDEWLIVRHSGEIPEIALVSVFYYLEEDEEGPRFILIDQEREVLRDAAKQRYREIVLRDLQPENRDKTIYRGVRRTIFNYQRFASFCGRQGVDWGDFTSEVGEALLAFFRCEVDDVVNGHRPCCLNVSYPELISFAEELGIQETECPEILKTLCLPIT